MKEEKLYISLVYDGVDITEDVRGQILSIEYLDHVEDLSDEITVTVEDVEGRWKNSWYPEKGSKLTLEFGYPGDVLKAGTFEIDQVESRGAPDKFIIKALAAGFSAAVRTERSRAFENQTLRAIIEDIAGRNGLTVEGTIEDIQIERATQHRETDLKFLQRIASKYGHVFSVRDGVITFTTIYELEAQEPAGDIDKTGLADYNFRDVSIGVFSGAEVRHQNPDEKKVIQFESFDENFEDRSDRREIRERAENAGQAEAISKAALHEANSLGVTGDVKAYGAPGLVAGINYRVTGLGEHSGVYHIKTSRHVIEKETGYATFLELKKVGEVPNDLKTPRRVRI